MQQLEKQEIRTYNFPATELGTQDMWMRDRLPCAVVGSNTVLMDEKGNKFRGREYPWGSVNIEDKVQVSVLLVDDQQLHQIRYDYY